MHWCTCISALGRVLRGDDYSLTLVTIWQLLFVDQWLRRRLVLESRYQTSCEKVDGGALITDSIFQQVATVTFDLLDVCDRGKLRFYWLFLFLYCVCNISCKTEAQKLAVEFYGCHGWSASQQINSFHRILFSSRHNLFVDITFKS